MKASIGGKRARPRPKHPTVDVLTQEEAQVVLQEVLAACPALSPDVEKIAENVMAKVAFNEVAANLSTALQELDMDDTDAGSHAWGYLEPSEAACKLVSRTVEPYLADLKRRLKLRHETEAMEVCKGIVLGLYRAEQADGELLEYATDCHSELAGEAVDIWRRRNRRRKFPPDFVEKFTPEWTWLLR